MLTYGHITPVQFNKIEVIKVILPNGCQLPCGLPELLFPQA
jgi:hypothetical protein